MNFPIDVWPLVLAVLATAIAGVASAHAILRKRDVRAAIGWVGLIWLAPFVGSALYGLFGINRISRRASELHLQQRRPRLPGGHTARSRSVLATALPASARHLSAI